jgi:hypothetical protein
MYVLKRNIRVRGSSGVFERQHLTQQYKNIREWQRISQFIAVNGNVKKKLKITQTYVTSVPLFLPSYHPIVG